MQTSRLELLQRMPIFGAIREDALEFLLEQTRHVEVAEGEYFFREGEPAACMYVLESGRVAVFRSWKGRDLLLRHLDAGDCFGEMALMDLATRSASVRAVLPCVAIEITPAQLHGLFRHDVVQFALIQMNIGREVCRRLRETDDMLFRERMGAEAGAPDSHTAI